MPHEISTGKHPDIVVLRYYGDIESKDIITNADELQPLAELVEQRPRLAVSFIFQDAHRNHTLKRFVVELLCELPAFC